MGLGAILVLVYCMYVVLVGFIFIGIGIAVALLPIHSFFGRAGTCRLHRRFYYYHPSLLTADSY